MKYIFIMLIRVWLKGIYWCNKKYRYILLRPSIVIRRYIKRECQICDLNSETTCGKRIFQQMEVMSRFVFSIWPLALQSRLFQKSRILKTEAFKVDHWKHQGIEPRPDLLYFINIQNKTDPNQSKPITTDPKFTRVWWEDLGWCWCQVLGMKKLFQNNNHLSTTSASQSPGYITVSWRYVFF